MARLGRVMPYLGSHATLVVAMDWVKGSAPPVPRAYRGWGAPKWFDPYFARPVVTWAAPGDWRSVNERTYRLARRKPRGARPVSVARPATPTRAKPASKMSSWKPPASIEDRLREQRERIERVIRPPTIDVPGSTLPKIPSLPGSRPDPPDKKKRR